MPNTFIEHRDRWMSLSEVDYLGQFVKAWLAFNAWYRSAYTEPRDRIIIEEFKWQPNPVANKLRPLLSAIESEESQQFRSDIGLLHHRLQNYEIHTGKGSEKERISLENIYLRNLPPCRKQSESYGYKFVVERVGTGHVTVNVTNRTGAIVLSVNQTKHSIIDLEADTGYAVLSTNQQGFLRALYREASPRQFANLTVGSDPAIKCGSFDFRCTAGALFAGTVEAVYMMRCTLFHGELMPTREANACYEPAYYLIRRFLHAIA